MLSSAVGRGAFPIFCNRLCDWGKTTLPGVNTTVRFIKNMAEVTKNRECTRINTTSA